MAPTYLPADQTAMSWLEEYYTINMKEVLALAYHNFKAISGPENAELITLLANRYKDIKNRKKHVESTKNEDKTADEDLFDSQYVKAAKGTLSDPILGFHHPQNAPTYNPADQTAMSSQKMFSDEFIFVKETFGSEFHTFKDIFERYCADTIIPLPNITSKIQSKDIEFCKKLVDLNANDYEFVKAAKGTLFDPILGFCHPQIASTYLPADQATTSSQKTIVLKSSDGETFEVEEAVALESQTIKHMIEDECADTSIPLHHVDSKTLSKVIEYCKKHVESTKNEDKTAKEYLKAFDSAFAEAAKGSLFDLIQAADYLNIKSLLDLTCQAAVDMAEDIRRAYNIITALEEEACMKKPCDYLV